jgi:hypothetical protein
MSKMSKIQSSSGTVINEEEKQKLFVRGEGSLKKEQAIDVIQL